VSADSLGYADLFHVGGNSRGLGLPRGISVPQHTSLFYHLGRKKKYTSKQTSKNKKIHFTLCSLLYGQDGVQLFGRQTNRLHDVRLDDVRVRSGLGLHKRLSPKRLLASSGDRKDTEKWRFLGLHQKRLAAAGIPGVIWES